MTAWLRKAIVLLPADGVHTPYLQTHWNLGGRYYWKLIQYLTPVSQLFVRIALCKPILRTSFPFYQRTVKTPGAWGSREAVPVRFFV